MWHGIAAHFYWRQVVLIVAVIVVVPIVLLPLYQQRASEIIGSQGEVFVSTTLGSTREALYDEDFTFVIQYVQRVLKNTDQILQVILKSNDGRVVRIDAEHWSLATEEEFADLPIVQDRTLLYRSEDRSSSAFTYASQVLITTFHWGDIYIDIDGSAYQRLIRNFWTGYAVVSITLLLGSMGFLWLSARPVVRQLAELQTVAGEIGEGRFAHADESGIGEIAGLAHALNSMTDSLQDKTEQVHQLARVVRETNEAFMLFDATGNSLFANEAMTKLLDRSENRLMNEDIWGILDQLSLEPAQLDAVRQGIASPKGLTW
ncbi:MAG: HAMP domain-containing protein, partial [Pseudomonadota bacterium]